MKRIRFRLPGGIIGRLAVWVLITAAFELLIGNYSSVRSLFYQACDLTGNMRVEGEAAVPDAEGGYVCSGGEFSVTVEGLDMELHNLHFAMELPGEAVVSYTVSLRDEGNHYEYWLPEQELVEGIPSLFYTNIYPYGKVKELRISFTWQTGGEVRLSGLTANAKRPFFPVWPRVAILLAAGFLMIALGKDGALRIAFRPESVRQNLVTAALVAAFLGGGLWLARANTACVESPWAQQQQYQELAEAISEGHVWVDEQEAALLKEVENPYDTIYLLANQIPYRADYVYFEGRYYVYFGIVPELLFFLPCYLLTGKGFPNYLAVYLLYCGFVISVFGLYREAAKRWFQALSYPVYLLAASVTLTFGSFVYLLARPDMYHIPMMGANMFTAAGLWLWLWGLNRKKGGVLIAAGSLCMALVAGCRPQMLLFSVLAVPLFWKRIFGKEAHASGRVRLLAALALPYVVVAAGIMYYNYLRFGSPLDFGAAYSLTNNDMTHRGINLSRIVYGIYCFFFQPARYEGVFPFLTSSDISSRYMGRMVSEFLFGGIFASQAVAWSLLLVWPKRGELRRTGLLAPLLLCIGCSLLIGAFDANGAGILQRYTADQALGIALAVGLLWCMLSDGSGDGRLPAPADGSRKASPAASSQVSGREAWRLLFKAALLQHFAYGFLMIFACGDSVNLKNYGQALFYGAMQIFRM